MTETIKSTGSRSSPRNLKLLDITAQSSPSSSVVASPTAVSSPNRVSISSPKDTSLFNDSIDGNSKKKKPKKSACPCGRSSAGRDWVIVCSVSDCKQHWHSSCANLKGANSLSQQQVEALTRPWQCPWCFTTSFPKLGSHSSTLNESSLLEKALSCSVIQSLNESLAETIKKSLPKPVDISNLEACLENLTKEVKEFKDQAPSLSNQFHRVVPKAPTHEKRILKCPETPFEDYQTPYLSTEHVETLTDLLGYLKDSSDFIPEKGHNVKLYGEPYSYTGSHPDLEPDPIPDELKTIIDKLSSDLSLAERPNSVLINHYPASSRLEPMDSHLAMHSDDESSILAESKIITLSIGACRKIVFEPKHHEKETGKVELDLNHNSMYVMTRTSQNWFRHGVPPVSPGECVEERFSITFRTLKKQFKRSMLLIGDSNSKDVKYGEGSGRVGKSYPGRRVKAAKVENIDPKTCVGYSNAFIMCGTNDLRCENIKKESDIHTVVNTLKEKLIEIRQLCPDTKLFVIPVMPSRIVKMNHNIALYNELVDRMLFENFPDVWYQGIYSFLDNQGLLSIKLTRENDKIHLNDRGIARLVTYMKTCVFKRESYEGSHRVNYVTKQESAQKVGSPDPT